MAVSGYTSVVAVNSGLVNILSTLTPETVDWLANAHRLTPRCPPHRHTRRYQNMLKLIYMLDLYSSETQRLSKSNSNDFPQ